MYLTPVSKHCDSTVCLSKVFSNITESFNLDSLVTVLLTNYEQVKHTARLVCWLVGFVCFAFLRTVNFSC